MQKNSFSTIINQLPVLILIMEDKNGLGGKTAT